MAPSQPNSIAMVPVNMGKPCQALWYGKFTRTTAPKTKGERACNQRLWHK